MAVTASMAGGKEPAIAFAVFLAKLVANETEIKLPVPSVRGLHRNLTRLHARIISPRTHEFNTLYDTPQQTLFRQGKLIRIRVERISRKQKKPSQVILTFKGPIPRSSSRDKHTNRYKVREEIEVVLPSADPIEHLLQSLGLRPAFRYEKFRTTYALPGIKGLKIELDETPAGNFLELEGKPSAIDRAANRLGYAPSDYSTRTYADIHSEMTRRRGKKITDMLF